MTTSDKQQASRALDTLGNLRQALRRHMDARSDKGWAGSSVERKRLARVAREVMQIASAEAWHNLGPSLDQSVGHLWGHLGVYADVDSRFVSDFTANTFAKIEDVEQALRSRLDGSLLTFPVTPTDLTRLAGLNDVQSVTQQIDRAVGKDRRQHGEPALAKSKRGNSRTITEAYAKQAHPHLRNGSKLKEFLASALEIK